MSRICVILLFKFTFMMILLSMPSFGFLSSVRLRKERASSLAYSKEAEEKFFVEIEKIITEKVSYYIDEFEALLNQTIIDQFDIKIREFEASNELLLSRVLDLYKLAGYSVSFREEDENDSLDGKLIGYLYTCPQC